VGPTDAAQVQLEQLAGDGPRKADLTMSLISLLLLLLAVLALILAALDYQKVASILLAVTIILLVVLGTGGPPLVQLPK
jgi:uncharacterized membrane protein YidH (DUF202 family)